MPGLNPEQLEVLMKIVSDPRYTQEKAMRALQPAAELKHTVMSRGLVGKMNKAYGWNLPSTGNWDVERANDICYDIVLKPGYTLNKFIAAIEAGRKF
jgi:hypothetical protein